MMKKASLTLLALMALTTPAQALKLIVWDRELQTKVAYGESIAGKFTVKFDKDYSGPVVALFSQTDDEKDRGTYAGLQSRYEGVLRGGQLLLGESAQPGALSAPANRSGRAGTLSLGKLLEPYKLAVSVQPTSQLPPMTNVLLTRAR